MIPTEQAKDTPPPRHYTDLDVISPVDDSVWDAFVESADDGHLLQTSAWGALKARFGWDVDRLAIAKDDRLIAGAQVLYRPLPSRLSTLAYVPMGPLVDWEDEQTARALLQGLRGLARRRRAYCLRLEPGRLYDEQLAAELTGYGLQPNERTFQPRRSIVIDLDGSEEELLARMHSKTRYNIRLAARKDVQIREGTQTDLGTFQQMLADTTERDGFSAHAPAYYQAIYELFVPTGKARFLLATYHGIPLAGVMVFVTGRKAFYMYGASSNQHRHRMPNYLLQWEAIKWARAKGCTTYDLWGVPDEEEEILEQEFSQRTEGLWGVYRFKRGFGGRVVRLLGAYDHICSRSVYWMVGKASTLLERIFGETWHRRLRPG